MSAGHSLGAWIMKAGLECLLAGVSIIAAAATFGGSAKAASILAVPDAIYSATAEVIEPSGQQHVQSTNLPTPGVSVVGGNPNYNPPKTWIAQVATNYQIPSITAGVSVDTGVLGVAGSTLHYFVAFAGADGLVPIVIKAGGSAALATFDTAPGTPAPTLQDNRSAAFLNIAEASDQTHEVVSLYAESNFDNSPGGHLFSLDQQFMLQANTVYEVTMYATVYAAYGRIGTAYVDPFFVAPAGYSVLTSAGIGNASPATTPIPAALPLFAGALGLLPLVGWRKRKAASPTA